jgi:hypothetical protein
MNCVDQQRAKYINPKMSSIRLIKSVHHRISGSIFRIHLWYMYEKARCDIALKLTERCKYVRPNYPSWVDNFYLYPVMKLAKIFGEDLLKDFAVGESHR